MLLSQMTRAINDQNFSNLAVVSSICHNLAYSYINLADVAFDNAAAFLGISLTALKER